MKSCLLLAIGIVLAQSGVAPLFAFDSTGSLNTPRDEHAAVLLPNGKVLVAGGRGIPGSATLTSAELYDPATGMWTATGNLGTSRFAHSMTLLANGKVLVAGGYQTSPRASSELYDPATGIWTPTGNLNIARLDHTATLLPNGKVLVAGGEFNPGSPINSAELYDPATGLWTVTGNLGVARYAHTETLLPNGKVLVAGGFGSNSASAELYDPATGTWTATGNLTGGRAIHKAVLLPSGKVLVAAGRGPNFDAVASAELYDPASGTWTTTGSLAVPRYGHTMTLLASGKVLSAGGVKDQYLTSAEVYNPATGLWTSAGNLTTARYKPTATRLADGKVLFAGGFPESAKATAELYKPPITVNSSSDAGGTCPGTPCTLRQAILTAAPGDTIDFASGLTTIDLTSAELLINKNLTIAGPGANVLTVRRVADFAPSFRIFNITSGTVNISGLTIANGFLFGGSNGGGISNAGTLTLAACTVSGNSAGTSSTNSGSGGGIYNLGTLSIISSTVSTNSAAHGGGGLHNSGGTATVINSTFSGNFSRPIPGGGIFNTGGTIMLTNCTITANVVGTGVVNDSPGVLNVRNTIIAKNPDPAAVGQSDVLGNLASQGYNLIGVADGATITPVTGDQIGTAASPIDPMLGPLQDNGGPTLTHALLGGSPARDKGNSSGSSMDQRGFTRPVDNPFIPNAPGSDGSDIGAFEVQAGLTARSLNISTRARVQTGDNVLIAGFIVTGNTPKQVVLRGLGPSLANAGVPAATVLNDPVLELHGASGALISANDNWRDSPQKAQIEGTLFQPADDRESVIVATLPPASYTAVIRGVGNGTGVGLVEVYDVDSGSDSMLTNISSRAFVETGNNVVIAGFNLGGSNSGSPQVIIRGLGPSLASFGIANPLTNPTLELRDSNGSVMGADDNWQDAPSQKAQIVAAGLAPQNDLEAAIAAALPPGAYTAILAGQNGGTGVGTVEVYNVQ